MRKLDGHYVAPRGKIALVVARFNELVVDKLVHGAHDMLVRHGVSSDDIECIRVPGAYEIPFACKQAANTGRFVGVVGLGAVIRGSTGHYDFVAGNCASGILQASLESNMPMTLGVLTTDTLEQAIERAGTKAGNKGADAALSLLELIDVTVKIND